MIIYFYINKNINYNYFGDNMEEKEFITLIKQKRRNKKLLQKDLAKLIPISKSSYSKLENGKMSLNFFLIRRLSELLDIDLNEIKVNNYNKFPYFD